MGGGASKPTLGPCPPEYTSDASTLPAPDEKGNYQFILADGKECNSFPLKWDGKPIVVGRSESQGSTHRSNDEGTSALHLELSWDGTNWIVKDLESKKGTRVITSNVPVDLKADGPPHKVTGPCCFHCGINTFVTLIPANMKSCGLECTKMELEQEQKFSKGQFTEVKKSLVFGRAPDSIGRPVIFHKSDNVSGSHLVLTKEGRHMECTDCNATHKTVVAMTKLNKECMVALWPGAEVTLGSKEKHFKEPPVVWVVKMAFG
ncbi:hypothetical protein TrRE_jg3074 [Triparma retinervis]|uniref:FHA domain-containing protein n=1 Tax=Triparma retinervis TaxID=2557542 RepID=A0A9W7FEV2_9STRA|nr:hypothetical protein TrRE_jg3074 [Triparma retinervis]